MKAQFHIEDEIVEMIYKAIKRGRKTAVFEKALKYFYENKKDEMVKEFENSLYAEAIDKMIAEKKTK